MTILLIAGMGYVLVRDCANFTKKEKLAVVGVIIAYIVFLIYYVNYINSQPLSFGYGIPQADMLAHYKGAEAISQGASWDQLSSIAVRYESVGIGSIGYFIYATFLSFVIFDFGLFDPGTNVYLVYVLQIFIAIDACVRFGKFFHTITPGVRAFEASVMLIACAPFVVQSCQLMRDVYYMWLIAFLLETVISLKSDKAESMFRGGSVYIILALVSAAVLCVLLRVYSLIIFLPLVLFYISRKRAALIVTASVSVVLIFGSGVIELIRQVIGISWTMSAPDFAECVSFLLFPNIINQTFYLLHWDQVFLGGMDVSGCNVPGVYFEMALWNIVMIPLAIVGFFSRVGSNRNECILWLLVLLSVLLLYSVSYESIDTRHKFFMCLPIVYLATEGLVAVRLFDRRTITLFATVLVIILLCLVAIYL